MINWTIKPARMVQTCLQHFNGLWSVKLYRGVPHLVKAFVECQWNMSGVPFTTGKAKISSLFSHKNLGISLVRKFNVRKNLTKALKNEKIHPGRYFLCFGIFPLFEKTHPSKSGNGKVPKATIPVEVFKKETMKATPRSWLFNIWYGLRLYFRVLRIMATFGPLLLFYPLTYLSKHFCYTWHSAMIWTMEHSGPTFIKLGQWAATRRDIFSQEFCDKCSRLHNSTRQHSWASTKHKLRMAFGKHWKEIFVHMEKDPIGSGCIAQVHRAYIKASMIPDESVIEEILGLANEREDSEIDFVHGLEIMGLLSRDDGKDKGGDVQQVKITNSQQDIPGSQENRKTPGHYDQQVNASKLRKLHTTEMTEGEPLVPVAVKVLHPGVYEHVCRDLTILRTLAHVAEKFVPSLKWLSLHESVEEFSALLTHQIDLRFEAESLMKFTKNFENNPGVRFPLPIQPYCKKSVLVETLEDGEPISNFLLEDSEREECQGNSSDKSALKRQLASQGVQALLQMVFVDNFVHGDLHPGNILVQRADQFMPQADSSRLLMVDVCDTVMVIPAQVTCPLRLVLLDTGIVSSLNQTDLANLRKVFTAVIIGDGDKVADLMLKHARYNECSNVEKFKQELGGLVCRYRQDKLQLGKVQVGELLSEVFTTCINHKVKMESRFASVMLAIFVLEGLGRSLDPDLDILEKARPILLGL